MNIESASYVKLDLKLNKPYTTFYESHEEATNYILKITTTDGLSGYGSSAPEQLINGEYSPRVEKTFNNKVIPYLIGKNPFHRNEIMAGLTTLIPMQKSTLAMVNIALFDLLARRARLPLYYLLGGFRHCMPTSATIGILPLDATLTEARRFWSRGFRILKVQGGLDIEADLEKLVKLRAQLGNTLKIRFDANQGYSPNETIRFIKDAQKLGVEVLQHPVAEGVDLSLSDHYDNSPIPLMRHENVQHLNDAFHLARNSTTDMINIKLQYVGGIDPAMHINSVAKASGNEIMIGCLDECGLGISAALHFALSRPNVTYADLDPHMDLENDPFRDFFKLKEGILYPKMSAGLGSITEEILDLFSGE